MRNAMRILLFVVVLIFVFQINVHAVTISLDPDNMNVSPGQQFNVDVVLNNLGNEGLSGIGIWLKYDANLLSVVDTDSGNWVTSGVNILDGPYHGLFDLPGDPGLFDNVNDASVNGEISWDSRRSFTDYTNIDPSGIFATITFQAKDALGSTALDFYGGRTGGYPDTYVWNANDEQILTDVSGTTINVVPEPASLLLLGSGLIGLIGIGRRAKG